MNITESIKFDKLQEENEKLKKELAEKDKYIEKLKLSICKLEAQPIIAERNLLKKYIDELKQQQLFKEDFTKEKILEGFDFRRGLVDTFTDGYVLKDNSKYENLPSKEEE